MCPLYKPFPADVEVYPGSAGAAVSAVAVSAAAGTGRSRSALTTGETFDSSFEPVNPTMHNLWQRLDRNNVVHAQHWRHDDGPHPTLCVIHGFLGSPYLFNGLFFSLPWFYRSGFDVLLYTLPFHGRRAERFSPFSGFGYFAGGLSGFAESMAQAVHDFRSVVDHLRRTGVERVALTGLSLGGYTTALLAAIEDRLEAVIPNCPMSRATLSDPVASSSSRRSCTSAL